ncbi:MAG: hypothetical protein EHM31_12665, partial [Candidatus Aminicenantes bacterium]
EWTGIDRVVAVADLHGDYDRFVFILAHPQVGLIDDELRWTGGKTHLVQLGDVVDRGPRAREILDLLMRLEKEAAAAGGMVHMLLGNHEEMNITGIALDYPGYVTVEQFVSFLPDDFRREREAGYLKTLSPEDRKRAEIEGLDVHADDRLADFWRKVMAAKDPDAMRAYVLGFNKACGDWLVKKNTVIKINDVVYAHGGITETLSKWPIREINQVIRTELEFFQGRMRNPQDFAKPFHPKLVYDPDSPLWFRGLATKNEAAAQAEIDRTLANLGARAIVVGHNYFRFAGGSSPTIERRNVSRFQDKVWIMDTGISSGSYGGIPSALIYEHGEFQVWGETEEVAARSGIRLPPPKPLMSREMEAFLRTAAVTGHEPGPGGRTDAWRITLEARGVVLPALFKYIDRRRPDPLADSYRYDLAAYALNKYLGLSYAPPIIERTVENVPGALQAFISGARPLADFREKRAAPPDPEAFEKAMADLVVFQALVYDDCRNEKDTLVGEDGRIYRVDFSEAFAPNKGDGPGCEIKRCSRLLYRRLLGWEDRTVAAYLGRYLGPEEIRALNTRRTFMVRRLRMMIKSLGEANVLF